jgi:hypothetical protein
MPIKRFICTDIQPTASEKLLYLKQGLKRDFNGAWLSRESIDMISAIEGYDVWNGFMWQEVSNDLPEHEYEIALKTLRDRPE